MIILRKVCRDYQTGNNIVKALHNVDLEIDSGKFNVVLGPSGSGKSTLLNLLGGMDRATSGVLNIEGNDISNATDKELTEYRRTDVGFVFQFYNLVPQLTVYENVAISAKFGKNPLDVDEILKKVGLSERRNHFPRELSGGEMQRVSIARAICKNPKVLLCDEPTGALDSATGVIIIKLLMEMARDYKKTVIVVTHNAAIAEIADVVVRLKDGKIESIVTQEKPADIEEVNW